MKKLRLGVIGTGSVVREIYQHLYFHSAYTPLLSVEGAADTNPQALQAFCDRFDIPPERRFDRYEEMIERLDLEAVQVNTPDSLHRDPAVYALERGLDVLVPKPLADTIADAHAMLSATRKQGRLIVADYHKRDDPRIREVATLYQSGVFGRFQVAVWYMLDKLLVADPNHEPRFFASSDFAEKNSPLSFLTVHMADAFLRIVKLKPTRVRAVAFSQKLPSLKPRPVRGYDVCDTEVTFEGGGVAHIITGWHLPNTAHSITVQSSRMICTDGLIDLTLDASGTRDITVEGIIERNSLFRTFEADGTVTGYGMSYPGRLFESILRRRDGLMKED
jgi:predicted dehydrogenase